MSSIKTDTFKGLIWASIGNIGGGLINILITMLLARLLNPSDFGILELIIVVTSISVVFVDSGFSQALIRDRNATSDDFSTVFFINLLISCVLYIILFFTTPILASFWSIENFTILGRVAFLVIIFDALGLIQNVTFTKSMNFKPIAIAVLVSTLLAGIIGALLAYLKLGVWALVSFLVLTSVFKTIILWIQGKWLPKATFSRKSLIKYYKFGSFLFIQSLVDKIMINIESLLIGRFYTKSQLGFFSQSRKIDSYLGQALTNIVVKVSYPALVKINDTDAKLKNGYRKIIGLTTFVIIPFMLFMIVFPDLCMATIFGEKWADAGIYLRWWAIFGIVHPIQSICNNIFYVKGKSKELLIITVVKQVLKAAAIIALVNTSVLYMQIGIILTSIIMMLVYVARSGRLISYNTIELGKDVSHNFLSGIIAVISVYFFYRIAPIQSPLVMFLCLGLLHIAVYFSINLLTKNVNLLEITSLVKKTMHK